MIAWNPAAAPLLLVAPLFLLAGLALILVGSGRGPDRALTLFFLGWSIYTSSTGLGLTATTPAAAYAFQIAGTVGVHLFHLGYALFLGTLPTPLARYLRTRSCRAFLVTLYGALIASTILYPRIWQVTVLPAGAGPTWINVPGAAWAYSNVGSLLLFLVGIILAVSAFRRADSPLGRRQTGAYLLGFAVFDGTMLLLLGVVLAGVPLMGRLLVGPWFFWGVFLAATWLMTCLLYGVLSARLFDIDLKIKWTIGKTTLFAFFVALFFVVSESAAVFLGDRWGTYAGILAAGLLLFAIVPLQRLAERVADRAMPDVDDTPEYHARRKEEVYRATLEEMIADGNVTIKERRALLRLQEVLGLDAAVANRIEVRILSDPGLR